MWVPALFSMLEHEILTDKYSYLVLNEITTSFCGIIELSDKVTEFLKTRHSTPVIDFHEKKSSVEILKMWKMNHDLGQSKHILVFLFK